MYLPRDFQNNLYKFGCFDRVVLLSDGIPIGFHVPNVILFGWHGSNDVSLSDDNFLDFANPRPRLVMRSKSISRNRYLCQ